MTVTMDRPDTKADVADAALPATKPTHVLTILQSTAGPAQTLVWSADPAEVTKAREAFDHYRTDYAFLAYTVDAGTGQPTAVVREFDPEADIVMSPRLVGG